MKRKKHHRKSNYPVNPSVKIKQVYPKVIHFKEPRKPEVGEYVLYTDGACSPNNGRGVGGWACNLMDSSFNQVWGDSGAKEPTTNNDMELTAILCGLKQMGEGAKVQVRSDSQYALDCVFNWSRKWKARGWVKSGGPIKNLDVIKQVVAEIERIGSGCVPMWVRGHAGDMFNEAVDKQSVDAARKLNAKLYDSAA